MYAMDRKPEEKKIKKKKQQCTSKAIRENQLNGYIDSPCCWKSIFKPIKQPVVEFGSVPTVQMQKEFVPINADLFPTINDAALPIPEDVEKRPEWYKKLGQYQYVSEDNGVVGSLYFENGRIRLLHMDGPIIEIYKKERYLVSRSLHERGREAIAGHILTVQGDEKWDEGIAAEKMDKGETVRKFREKILRENQETIRNSDTSWRLFEMSPSGDGRHISRGIAAVLNFTHDEMEKLYQTVSNVMKMGGSNTDKNNYLALNLKSLWGKLGWTQDYLFRWTENKRFSREKVPDIRRAKRVVPKLK